MTPSPSSFETARRVALGLLLLMAVAGAVGLHRPPPVRGLETGPTEFSAARALEHLRWVAAAPRPVGSARLREVRERLLAELAALGVSAEVQRAEVVRTEGPGDVLAGEVANVLARLPGTDGQRAVLVVAHYDSVPSGPGAGDDGAAVAAMLETVRALRAGPPLAQDVLFLFTDAEEVGLLGAEAFPEHPLFAKVAVVLNFEARGSRGPSLLFELAGPQPWLLERFLEVAPHPLGTSLASSIYELLPNDTDLTVFRRAGRAGMNFAFIDGFIDYHTRRDDVATLDPRSLQHHGENMLALVRVLANAPPPPVGADAPALFFNPVGTWVVHYPQTWAVPFAVLLLIAEGLALVRAVRAGRARAGRVVGAAGLVLAAVLFAVPLVLGLWWGVSAVTGLDAFPQHDAHEPGLFLLGLSAAGLAVFAGVGGGLGARWLREAEATLGARLPWSVLTLVSAGLLPGGSYFFAWPLLLTAPLVWTEAGAIKSGLVRAVGGAGALLVAVSTLYPLGLVLGLSLAGVGVGLSVLLLGLLRPVLASLSGNAWGGLAGASALGAALLLLGGASRAGVSSERPRPDGLAYWLDADSHRAWWLADPRLDEGWPAPVLGETPSRGRFREALPWVGGELLAREVPPASLPEPRMHKRSERRDGAVREVVLHLEPVAGAALLRVRIRAPARVLGAAVGRHAVAPSTFGSAAQGFSLEYWQVPPEGVSLTLRLRGEEPVRLHLSAVSLAVPALPGGAVRPPYLMAAPYGFGLTDTTVVTKTESL